MVMKESLEGMTAEQVAQISREVTERRQSAIASANAAIRSYETAVSTRDTKIQEMKDNLTKQLENISTRTASLNAALVKAALADDVAKQAKLKAEISGLAGQHANLKAQLELLSAKPPRCDGAYASMEKTVAECTKAAEQCETDAQIIREVCEEMVRRWDKILSELRYYGGLNRSDLDRARSHYTRDR